MTNANGSWMIGVLGLVIGLAVGHLAAPEETPANPQERGLDANLWMQTSGEYRACCLQAYNLAQEKLRQKLKTLPKEGKPAAVVMDLDETVFDNGGYETWLLRSGKAFTLASWKEWEKNHYQDVRLVPGAREFIESTEKAKLPVTVVYISNRTEENRAYTIKALEHVKLDTENINQRLLLDTGTADKTDRRKEVAAKYRVLMLFGDNLRDFSEVFKAPKVDPSDVVGQNKAIAQRKQKVDQYQARWGDDWIILPNPAYGEWTKLVGSRPLDNLRPKMKEP
jgi:5'-nucleotidase (lipoprotein e(P4) family)